MGHKNKAVWYVTHGLDDMKKLNWLHENLKDRNERLQCLIGIGFQYRVFLKSGIDGICVIVVTIDDPLAEGALCQNLIAEIAQLRQARVLITENLGRRTGTLAVGMAADAGG